MSNSGYAGFEQSVYTPSQLNHEVRTMLETALGTICVEGELSNLARPASGHLYFSLKDAAGQVRCAFFRGRAATLRWQPVDGALVRVRAKASLYPARGEFQLIVEHLEPAGEGALRRAFEALKLRLAAEGVFADALKRPLPALPRRLGVVTSPSGAAIRDVLTVLQRRFPALPVVIYPTPVQGEGAAEAIAAAIDRAGRRGEVDVVLLTRGGGSLEDLWPFNEEIVARAIRACPVPVVSGVGHEVDTTIADLAADLRAATPSAAAEALSPDGPAWLEYSAQLRRRLTGAIERTLRHHHERLQRMERRHAAQHPGRKLRDRAQRLDELDARLRRATEALLRTRRLRLTAAQQRLYSQSPQQRLGGERRQLVAQRQRLHHALHDRLRQAEYRLSSASRALHAVSPLATLERGYAVATRIDGGVIHRASEVKAGERIYTRLADGALDCRVETVLDTNEGDPRHD